MANYPTETASTQNKLLLVSKILEERGEYSLVTTLKKTALMKGCWDKEKWHDAGGSTWDHIEKTFKVLDKIKMLTDEGRRYYRESLKAVKSGKRELADLSLCGNDVIPKAHDAMDKCYDKYVGRKKFKDFAACMVKNTPK